MELDQILDAVGIADPPPCWGEYWAEAQRSFPGDGFIEPDLVDLVAGSTDLDEGFVDALGKTVAAVRGSEALVRLAWLWHYSCFVRDADKASYWPLPSVLPEELRAMFPAAVLITGLPRMLEMHRNWGIPEQVTRDTLHDIAFWSEHYRSVHGRWGFAELSWLQKHFLGRLFRLQRLEFMAMDYKGGYRVYRGKKDRTLITIAESGMKYRQDGLVDGTNHITDPDAWESKLKNEDGFVRGNVISGAGHALQETVEIRLDEWDMLLEGG